MKKFKKKQIALFALIGVLLISFFLAYRQGFVLFTSNYTDEVNGFKISYPLGWRINNGQCKSLSCAHFSGTRQRKNIESCQTQYHLATLQVEKLPFVQLSENGIPDYAERFGIIEILEYEEGKLFISPGVGSSLACWGSRYYVIAMLNNGQAWSIKLEWDRKSIHSAKQIFRSLSVE